MQNIITLKCPKCNNNHRFYKYGKDTHGNQKYQCRVCNHQFSPDSYCYKPRKNYPPCDRLPSYNVPAKLLFPDAEHIKIKSFSEDITNNIIESFNNRFKAWYKTKRGFRDFDSANAMIAVFVFFFNFIRPHQGLNGLTPAQVAGATYDPKTKNIFAIAQI